MNTGDDERSINERDFLVESARIILSKFHRWNVPSLQNSKKLSSENEDDKSDAFITRYVSSNPMQLNQNEPKPIQSSIMQDIAVNF